MFGILTVGSESAWVRTRMRVLWIFAQIIQNARKHSSHHATTNIQFIVIHLGGKQPQSERRKTTNNSEKKLKIYQNYAILFAVFAYEFELFYLGKSGSNWPHGACVRKL